MRLRSVGDVPLVDPNLAVANVFDIRIYSTNEVVANQPSQRVHEWA